MRKSNFLFPLLFLLFFSCKKDANLEKADLIDYVTNEDNGFSQTKEINGVKINVTYRPTDLMVSQEVSNLDAQNNVNRDSIRNKYKNYLYFILSYSRDNKELLSTITKSREEFNRVQNTLTFDMKNAVSLVNQDKDTIPFIDYNFSRTYGMSRTTNLLFIFKRDEMLNKSNELIFNVKDIGIGTGDLKFRYETNKIRNN